MAPGIHVLYVDDDPDTCELVATVLERTSEAFDVTTADGGREGLTILDGGSGSDVDCILSDYDMPRMDGLEFFDAVRDRDPAVPFFLVTGTEPGAIATDAIEAGITDYVRKRKLSESAQSTILANRIENAVEKRRAERARAETDRRLERYRTLVENAADPMYALDETGSITAVNDAMVDCVGDDRDELLGSSAEALFTEETVERATDALRGALEADPTDGSRFESAFETGDGNRRISETNVTPLVDDDGSFAGSVGVVREITSRKERERELSEYETILETAPFGLFVLDADATLVWANDEYASGFEESTDELLGIEFPKLVDRGYYRDASTDQYVENVRTLLSSDNDCETATYNVRFRPATGDERIYDVHTKLLPLEDGEFAGTVHALRDITQQQRYRRELERQNERLEEFASLVSHDLRNPLNVAHGHLDMLDERLDDQHVDELRWSLSRMTELVDGLLQLARQGKMIGEQERLSLPSVAREAWATVESTGARLEIDTAAEIYGDESRVRELLENLFRNAVEHGTDGGGGDDADPLVVTIGTIDGTHQSADDSPHSGGFYVEDTGPGLPADRESLFEFGYTTVEDGTGFGLAIVEQIAEAHDWTVTARDRDGGGARFEIGDVTVPTDAPRSSSSL
ncbi:PAS domain S-box protein [Natrinema amylolyticum]|uniref:PAS domain S-box protein n=1 Tax=Natrinema amylolyticum TaxID=2878679 RepID=UPI001CF9C22B|nr:PAS domain S-box protein [Natrinema amylolyticum]